MRLNIATYLGTAAVVFGTMGCTGLFGEKLQEQKPFEKKQNLCIKLIPQDLKTWLADGTSDIGRNVDCAVDAIDDFSKHVKGQTKSVYTKSELAEFISEFLTSADSPNAGDSASFTNEIIRVKQILLGGASDMVTQDELARLKSLLLRARPFLIELTPNIQTLLFRTNSATVDQVTSARTSLTKILDLVAAEFERGDAGRPEAGFRDLLTSAHKLGLENDSVENWISLAESVKVLVLAGEPDQLRSREWAPMIRTIAEGWGLALRTKYNLSENKEILARDFPMLESSVGEIVDILDRAVEAHDGSIPNEAFEKLFDVLDAKAMIPFGVSKATAEDLLPTFFGKLLYGRSYDNFKREQLHFGRPQLAKLRSLLNDWMAGQRMTNLIFANGQPLSIPQFGSALTARKFTQADFTDAATFAMVPRAQKQLIQFMAKGRPPVRDDQGRLVVTTKKELPALKKTDLNLLNGIRVGMEAVLSGWTHDRSAADSFAGLVEAEVQEAYLDLRDMGHDLNFIDARSNQAGTRTFMETAIFMSSSDGDARMGLQEAVEWLHFVSAGGPLADKMYHEMERTCAVQKKDILGNQKLNPDCFRKEFLRIWSDNMTNLPKLVSWAKADGSGERAKVMLTELENAGRTRGASQELVDSSEFRSMIPIAQYLESVFARFDSDQNGILDSKEVWQAFPLLAPFIKKMASGSAEGETSQKAVLSYILTYGEVPDKSVGALAALAVRYGRIKLGWYNEEADRLKVLTVIGSFGKAAKLQRGKDIAAFYEANKDNLRALIRTREINTTKKLAELFQCLPEAVPNLARDMATNADALTPAKDPIQSEVFIKIMKKIIDNDASLENYCLPF